MSGVVIPSPGHTAICGQIVCGEVLCGQMVEADIWQAFPLDIPFVPARIRIGVGLLAESGELELDGARVLVNPLLHPFVCIDLDLEAITCTPLDLVASSAEEIDLEPLVCLEA